MSPSLIPKITRRLARVKGLWRITTRIERLFPPKPFSGEPEYVTISDYDRDLLLRLDPNSYMGRCIYWHGYYSTQELMMLDRILEPDSVFVDVGANNGYFTVFSAKRVPKGKVLAFEPVQTHYENLTYNIQLNGFDNVETFKLGLADGTKTEIDIYTTPKDSNHDGLATIYRSDTRSAKIDTINLSTLDMIAEASAISKLDIIKIDVEGAELSVLRGAQNVLKRFRPKILIEMNRETFEAAGYSIDDVTAMLKHFDYVFYEVGNNGRLHLISGNFPEFSNVLCVVE